MTHFDDHFGSGLLILNGLDGENSAKCTEFFYLIIFPRFAQEFLGVAGIALFGVFWLLADGTRGDGFGCHGGSSFHLQG
ncbi:MAG: hypothetical protein ACLQVL_02490 [Terriglobia bacterium]